MDKTPRDYARLIYEYGQDYGRKHGSALFLDDMVKITKARLARECNETSIAAKQLYAEAHESYEAKCKERADAEADEIIARAKLDAVKAEIELLRTQSANERAALREQS